MLRPPGLLLRVAFGVFTLSLSAFAKGNAQPDAPPAAPKVQPPPAPVLSCQSGRAIQQDAFLNVLNYQDAITKVSHFEQLQKEDYRKDVAFVRCRAAKIAEVDKRLDQACLRAYLKSMEYMVKADENTAKACAEIEKASAVDCQGGGTQCLRDAAAGFTRAKKFLQVGMDDAGKAGNEFLTLNQVARTAASACQATLMQIAAKLRELKAQGQPIEATNEKVNALLGTERSFGKPLWMVLQDVGAPDGNPDKIEAKAREIEARIDKFSSNISYQDRQTTTETMAFHGNELAAASTTGGLANLSKQSQQAYAANLDFVDKQAQFLTTSADNRGPVPTPKSDPPAASATPQPGARQAGVSTGITPPPPAGSNSDGGSVAGASRMIDFVSKTSMSTSSMVAQAKSAGPTAAPSPLPLAREGVPSTGAEASSQARSSFGRSPASEPVQLESPADSPEMAKGDGVAGPKRLQPQHAPSALGNPGATQYPDAASPPVRSREHNGDSDLMTVDAHPGTTRSPASEAMPAASAKGEESGYSAEATRLAEAEVAKIEETRKLAPSLRDLLKQRLQRGFEEKLRKGDAAAAEAGGSAGTVLGAIRQVREQEPTDAAERLGFNMNASDTEAEVRRLKGAFGDGTVLAANLGSVDVSLFRRIHDAHRRHFRKEI